MKRLICAVFALCCLLLCACGGIDANYREVEQLLVIQAMGFDESADGVTLSVSSGSGGMGGQSEASQENVRMKASAASLPVAQELIEDHSASEELFFDHTSYIVIGKAALESSVVPYIDHIERGDSFRLDVPLFAAMHGSAEDIIIGTGNADYDSVSVLSSVERNVESRGIAHVYSAGEIAADLNANGSALMCAVKSVDAKAVMPDAQDGETTAVFDGYAVLREGKLVGAISADDALAVELLLCRSGPSLLELTANDCTATLRLSDCSCKIEPVCGDDGSLCALNVRLEVNADLCEYRGSLDINALEDALRHDMLSRTRSVLELSRELSCDFLQLGALLQSRDPFSAHVTVRDLQRMLPQLNIYIYVETDIKSGGILDE